jgi:hypothetical protein
MEETLGKDNFAMISDQIGELITGNSNNLKKIEEAEANIKKLQDKNDKLVLANGSLLQKIPMAKSEDTDEPKEKPPKKINLKDAFDKNGNFIH